MARWLIHDLRNPTQALTLVTELMGEAPEAGDPGAVETIKEATFAPRRLVAPSLLRRPLLISIRFASSRLERLMAARRRITQDAVHADHPHARVSP